MADVRAVIAPLLNANEPETRLAALPVSEGQQVQAGEVLCILESTKASEEVIAEQAGYVIGLTRKLGESIRAGDRLCWLADTSDWKPSKEESEKARPELPEGLRITEPARRLAERLGVDMSILPAGTLITERQVRELVAEGLEEALPRSIFNPRALVIYGGGGHGKSLIDLVLALGAYDLVGVLDDRMAPGSEVLGLAVLGGAGMLETLRSQGVQQAVNAVGGIGDIMSRVAVFERLLEAGFVFPSVIHPRAFVESSARLSGGVQVFAHAYVGSDARLGFGAIVNTGAIVSHDCNLDSYANISPGAMLAGGVQVGEAALIGMGVTVNLNVQIGPGARVGNSAVVKADVPPGAVVRAGAVWPEGHGQMAESSMR
jgi:acetyltransferase EpsM